MEDVLHKDKGYFASFDLVIAHNLASPVLEKLSGYLWADAPHCRLIVVRSAGFLAELFIQFHEHTGGQFSSVLSPYAQAQRTHFAIVVIDSHPDNPPSLRIDKPFPALLDLKKTDEQEMCISAIAGIIVNK